jgi:hypothetical protein
MEKFPNLDMNTRSRVNSELIPKQYLETLSIDAKIDLAQSILESNFDFNPWVRFFAFPNQSVDCLLLGNVSVKSCFNVHVEQRSMGDEIECSLSPLVFKIILIFSVAVFWFYSFTLRRRCRQC